MLNFDGAMDGGFFDSNLTSIPHTNLRAIQVPRSLSLGLFKNMEATFSLATVENFKKIKWKLRFSNAVLSREYFYF